jgi:hypothetical protein
MGAGHACRVPSTANNPTGARIIEISSRRVNVSAMALNIRWLVPTQQWQ